MSDLKTIAYPYAKAAFEFAKEKQTLDEWLSMLTVVVDVIEQPQVAAQVQNLEQGGKDESDAFVQFLFSVCQGFLDDHVQNLIKVMAENQRLIALRDVLSEFEELKNENDKMLDATVVSSEPLSEEQLELLTKSLEKKLDRKVTLTNEVDSELVGGIVVKAGELVIDGSLKSSIHRLATSLHM